MAATATASPKISAQAEKFLLDVTMREKNSEAASGSKGMYPSLGDDDEGNPGEPIQFVGEPALCIGFGESGEPGGWR